MSGQKSRSKGQRGEREWRDQLREHGYEAERGQQRSGSPDSPDVKCSSLPNIHFEVKRTETFQPYKALEQARSDCGDSLIPVVAHRRNGRRWIVVMDSDDWFNLVAETNQPLLFGKNV